MSENRIRKVASITASPKPARAPYGPATAGLEYDSDVKGIAVNPDGVVRAFPETWIQENTLQGASAVTAGNYNIFWIAPYGCEVVGVKVRFSAASSSGTVDVKKAPSGTAIGSGTSVLSAVVSTAGAANTNVAGALNATVANRQLAAGDALGIVAGGTLTSLADLVVAVELKRRPDTV
jgi:hypothetical protein